MLWNGGGDADGGAGAVGFEQAPAGGGLLNVDQPRRREQQKHIGQAIAGGAGELRLAVELVVDAVQLTEEREVGRVTAAVIVPLLKLGKEGGAGTA